MAGKDVKSKSATRSAGAPSPGAASPAGSKKRKAAAAGAEGGVVSSSQIDASVPSKGNKRAKKGADAAEKAASSAAVGSSGNDGDAAAAAAPQPPPAKRAAKFLKLQQKRQQQRLLQKQAKAKLKSASASTTVSTGAGTTAKPAAGRKQVKLSALSWKPVALPTEALSAGGGSTTDADFFTGLFDGNPDDYMGLQEVSGVSVKYAPAAKVHGRGGNADDGDDLEEEEEEDGGEEGMEVDIEDAGQSKGGKVIQFLVRDGEEDAEAEDSLSGAEPSVAHAEESKVPPPQAHSESSQQQQKNKAKSKTKAQPPDTANVPKAQDASAEEDAEAEDEDADDADGLAQVNWAALDSFDEAKLPGWATFELDARLKGGLWKLKFAKPTQIQAATLPHALGHAQARSAVAPQAISKKGTAVKKEDEDEVGAEDANAPQHRDIVGVAQTGSGKTLAYGLPILHHFLSTALPDGQESALTKQEDAVDSAADVRPLTALILTPTRELAIQVGDHLQALVDASAQSEALTHASAAAADAKEEKKHWVSIVTVCGGMSVQKQRRLLTRGRGADIVVATPGRLWELLSEDDDFAARMKLIRFLVIDEADRMVEVGHFAEMDNILNIVRRPGEAEDVGDAFVEAMSTSGPLNPVAQSFVARFEGGREDLQTFVFSATLSKTLQRNLTRAKRKTLSRKKKAETSTLDDLMMRVDFRDPDPVVVDLSPEAGVAEGVHEMKVECVTKDKDLYLYYFLLRYPGRTLVFLNSIDGIRRLVPILTHLGLHPFPLHSQLQQKQRLKNLDRFRAVSLASGAGGTGREGGAQAPPASAVILATDVAARGLDIKGVDHVVHYQLPRSADTYVHRSGRTGRAGTEGISLAMIDPPEKRVWTEICKSLNRKDSIPSMAIEFSFFDPLRARLELAKQIDSAEHRASKESHDDAWLRKMAQDADIDLEESDADEDDDGARRKGKKGKAAAGKGGAGVAQLKEELAALLRQPLKARGVSFKYITSGSRSNFAEEVLNTSRRDIVTDAPDLLTISKRK